MIALQGPENSQFHTEEHRKSGNRLKKEAEKGGRPYVSKEIIHINPKLWIVDTMEVLLGGPWGRELGEAGCQGWKL